MVANDDRLTGSGGCHLVARHVVRFHRLFRDLGEFLSLVPSTVYQTTKRCPHQLVHTAQYNKLQLARLSLTRGSTDSHRWQHQCHHGCCKCMLEVGTWWKWTRCGRPSTIVRSLCRAGRHFYPCLSSLVSRSQPGSPLDRINGARLWLPAGTLQHPIH